MGGRRRAKDRLPELVEAAVHTFGHHGYRGTQMADVARVMGLSEAALYRYVGGKDGLFRLVLRRALLAEDPPDAPLPLPSPPLEVTVEEIGRGIRASGLAPSLETALRRRRVDDAGAELDGIVRELFALTAATRPAMDMIERSAREVPDLARLVDVELRRPLVAALATYLRRRARGGHLRTTADPAVTARLVLETVTWFARHRHSDPDGAAITEEAAEAAVVDALHHALVPCDRGSRS